MHLQSFRSSCYFGVPFARILRSIPFLLAVLLAIPAAFGQTAIYWANTGTDFTAGASWGGIAPTGGNIAAFTGTAVTQPQLAGSYSVAGLSFSSGASGYILSGSGTLDIGSSGISNITSNTSTISVALQNTSSLVVHDQGGMTISGDWLMNGDVTLNGYSNSTLSGNLSGSGTLTVLTGAWSLSGTSTRSGATTLSGGVLSLDSAGALGTSGTISFGGGILSFSAANTTDYSARFSTAAGQTYDIDTANQTVTFATGLTSSGGSLAKEGNGTLILSGNNTYGGGTTINYGILQIGNGGTSGTLAGNVSLAAGTGVTFNRSDASTYASSITGSGGLVQAGSGTLTLTGNSSYSGGTGVNAGTLQVGNGGTSGAIAGDVYVASGATLAFNRSDAVSFAGVISGAGSLAQAGSNTLTLTGNNTYTGGTTVSAGTLQIGNGGTSGEIVGAVSVGNGATLAFNRSDAVSYGSVISGAGSLAQAGGNTLTLTGNNTYTGGTTVSAGTLQIGNGGTTGAISGDVSISSGATLAFDRSDAIAYAGAISGAGMLIQAGGNTLTLTGNNSYTGITSVNAGNLQVGNGGTTGAIVGDAAIASGSTFIFNRSNAVGYAGAISGAGSLYLSGSGTVTLSGNNTYTGGTKLATGTLALGSAGALGSSGAISFLGGTLQFSAANTTDYSARFDNTTAGQAFNFDTNGQNVTLGTAIGISTGSLTKSGTGTLVLATNNTFSGGTTVNGGTLQLGNGGVSGSTGSNFLLSSAGNLTFNRADSFSYGGVISGSGTVTVSGPGFITLAGTNTYTGLTTVNAGYLQVGNGGTTGSIAGNVAIGPSGTVLFVRADSYTYGGVISGSGQLGVSGPGIATFTANSTFSGVTAANNGTIQFGNGGTTGSIAGNIGLSSGNLIFNRSDSSTYAGIIAGTGTVTKTGAGALTLTGTSSYTGSTTVSGGSLLVNGTLNSTAVSVASGATLGGSGSIGGSTTFLSGSHLAPGNSPGTLTFTNGLTLNSGAVLDFQLGSTSDKVFVSGGTLFGPTSGTVTLNLSDAGGFAPNTYILFDFTGASPSSFDASDFVLGSTIAGYNYNLALNGNTLELVATAAAIPEPTTCAFLIGLGALGLAMLRRRRVVA